MGNKTSSQNPLNNYSCRITKDYNNPIMLSASEIKSQFGEIYIYFPLPKDFLKDDFNSIYLLYETYHMNNTNKESGQINKNNSKSFKSIINKIEFIEYSELSEKRSGKFLLRINTSKCENSMVIFVGKKEY